MSLTIARAVRGTAQAVNWVPPLAGTLLAVAIVAFFLAREPARAGAGNLFGLLAVLRIAALALALGAGFALDDPAWETLASSPAALPLRRGLRVLLVLAVLALAWAGMLWLAAQAGNPPPRLPALALTAESAALVTVALAVAAIRGGAAAGPAILATVMGMALLSGRRVTMLVFDPEDPQWTPAHRRWSLLLVLAVVVLVQASRDPAHRRVRLRL